MDDKQPSYYKIVQLAALDEKPTPNRARNNVYKLRSIERDMNKYFDYIKLLKEEDKKN